MKFNVDDFLKPYTFGDLKCGETFYYEPSGIIWMKLREDEYVYNSAVSLDDGTICAFSDNEHVIKLDIKLSPNT